MNKFVAMYLAIRTPLLWTSVLIFFLGFNKIVDSISFTIWMITLIFSEDSYDRYIEYKNKQIIELNNEQNEFKS